MKFQLWTQHVLPPYQVLRLLATSDDIENEDQRAQWLSGKFSVDMLEDHEQFLVCNEDSEYFQQPTVDESQSDG